MRSAYLLCCFLITVLSSAAQSSFRTVVPVQAVEWGQSFQVQFIYQGTEAPAGLQSPAFSRVRVVAGPVVYHGQSPASAGGRKVINYVYTLEAFEAGTVWIPGATLTVGGQTLRSPDAFVRILPAGEKPDSISSPEDRLLPGEDPVRKIRDNLFLKAEVNRRQCYPGEPVLASFKLYTRLSSRSDIIKNPGFYGFALFDMVNLQDHRVTREVVNGRWYDVHLIRQVQLFPLAPGEYTLDEMEVSNQVFFYRGQGGVRRPTQLAEGILDRDTGEVLPPGTEVHKVSMKTEPLRITVKPFPGNSIPEGFQGATGQFSWRARLNRDSLLRQEEGWLELELKGRGNLTQLMPPAISWPAGADAFEPEIRDEFLRAEYPLEGRRLFRYRFIMSRAGNYELPPVKLVFFDPDSNRFRFIQTAPLPFHVSNRRVSAARSDPAAGSTARLNRQVSRIAALIVSLAAVMALIFWATRRRRVPPPPAPVPVKTGPEEVFAPARAALRENNFYPVLYQCVWDWYRQQLQLQGYGMDQQQLFKALEEPAVSPVYRARLRSLLQRCEWQLYTGAVVEEEAQELLAEAMDLARSFPA